MRILLRLQSRRSNYIGPMAMGPLPVLADTLPRYGGGQGVVLSGEAVSKQGGHFINYIMPKALLPSGSLTFTPADDAHISMPTPPTTMAQPQPSK